MCTPVKRRGQWETSAAARLPVRGGARPLLFGGPLKPEDPQGEEKLRVLCFGEDASAGTKGKRASAHAGRPHNGRARLGPIFLAGSVWNKAKRLMFYSTQRGVRGVGGGGHRVGLPEERVRQPEGKEGRCPLCARHGKRNDCRAHAYLSR